MPMPDLPKMTPVPDIPDKIDFPEQGDNQISVLEDIDQAITQMICQVGEKDKEEHSGTWERIEAAVDSAACECVIPAGMLPHIKTTPSERSRAGRHYLGANNAEIKNVGQRTVKFSTNWYQRKAINFQSAEVSRVLVSVDKLNEAGCEVILSRKSPRIITRQGEVIPLTRKGGIFIMVMWVWVPDKQNNEANTQAKSSEVMAPVFPGPDR